MTAEELKAKLPLEAIYEFKPDCRYIIVCDPQQVDHKHIEDLFNSGFDLPPAVVLFTRNGVGFTIFEMDTKISG